MADKVTMTHPATGATFQCLEESVSGWEAAGWKRPEKKRAARKKSADIDNEE